MVCSKSGGSQLYGSRGASSFRGAAALPATVKTEMMVWHRGHRAASTEYGARPRGLTNHIARQRPSHNIIQGHRDFGPIGIKLSRTHAAILVPSLQLLSYFQNLYFTICSYPTFLQKDISLLPNMARVAGHSPKILVHPITLYSYCQGHRSLVFWCHSGVT